MRAAWCLMLAAWCLLMLACCLLPDAWTSARPIHKRFNKGGPAEGRPPFVEVAAWPKAASLWLGPAGVQASSSNRQASIRHQAASIKQQALRIKKRFPGRSHPPTSDESAPFCHAKTAWIAIWSKIFFRGINFLALEAPTHPLSTHPWIPVISWKVTYDRKWSLDTRDFLKSHFNTKFLEKSLQHKMVPGDPWFHEKSHMTENGPWRPVISWKVTYDTKWFLDTRDFLKSHI